MSHPVTVGSDILHAFRGHLPDNASSRLSHGGFHRDGSKQTSMFDVITCATLFKVATEKLADSSRHLRGTKRLFRDKGEPKTGPAIVDARRIPISMHPLQALFLCEDTEWRIRHRRPAFGTTPAVLERQSYTHVAMTMATHVSISIKSACRSSWSETVRLRDGVRLKIVTYTAGMFVE